MTAFAVLAYLAVTARKRSAWVGAAAGALAGVMLVGAAFLFIDAHDPPSSIYNTVYRTSFSVMGLTEGQFDTPLERLRVIFPLGRAGSFYFSAPPETTRAHLAEYVSLFPTWALAYIVIGMAALFVRPRWADGVYPLVGFLLIWGFAVTVSFSNYLDYYVPAGIFVSAWMGAGADVFLEGLDRLLKRNPLRGRTLRTVAAGAASLGLILLPVWQARADVHLAVTSGYTDFVRESHLYPIFAPDKAIQEARKVLNRAAPNAIVFAEWDKLYSLIYTAQFEADRADVTFHQASYLEKPTLAETARTYIDANIDQRPIYFTILLPELSEYYRVEDLGNSLYRLRRKP